MMHLQKQRYVYFMRSTCAEGRIKIGCSYQPRARLAKIDTWAMYEMDLIGAVAGNFATERALHEHFAADRLHREWFRSSPELLFVIEQMVAGRTLWQAIADYRRPLKAAA